MKKFLFTLLLPLMLPAGEVIFKNDFNRALTNWSIPPYYNGKMERLPAMHTLWLQWLHQGRFGHEIQLEIKNS